MSRAQAAGRKPKGHQAERPVAFLSSELKAYQARLCQELLEMITISPMFQWACSTRPAFYKHLRKYIYIYSIHKWRLTIPFVKSLHVWLWCMFSYILMLHAEHEEQTLRLAKLLQETRRPAACGFIGGIVERGLALGTQNWSFHTEK